MGEVGGSEDMVASSAGGSMGGLACLGEVIETVES